MAMGRFYPMNKWNEISDKKIGEKYYLYKFENGLTLCVFPKKMSTFYAVCAVKYGANDCEFIPMGANEYTKPPLGVAHFLEHKMFDMPSGNDAFSDFAALGANANAFTSSDKTAYLFSCTDNFYESLGVLCNMVSKPYFTNESVKKEQGIIAQEIRMYDDSPSSKLYRNLLLSLYSKHPIRKNVCGTVNSISKITPKILYDCHKTFYNPMNTVICVCGDCDKEKVLEIVKKDMASLSGFVPQRMTVSEPKKINRHKVEEEMDVSLPIMMIGLKDCDLKATAEERQKRCAAVDILLNILFGVSSHLHEKTYTSGLLSGNFDEEYENSDSYAYAAISAASHEPEKLYDEICAYISCLRLDKTIGDDEFLRAKRAIYADEICAYDSTEEIANSFVDFFFDGFDMLKYSSVIADVTKDDVISLLRSDMFCPDNFVLSVIKPNKK